MNTVIADLIKIWGLHKVMQALIVMLRKQGKNEQQLSLDLETAMVEYDKRRK